MGGILTCIHYSPNQITVVLSCIFSTEDFFHQIYKMFLTCFIYIIHFIIRILSKLIYINFFYCIVSIYQHLINFIGVNFTTINLFYNIKDWVLNNSNNFTFCGPSNEWITFQSLFPPSRYNFYNNLQLFPRQEQVLLSECHFLYKSTLHFVQTWILIQYPYLQHLHKSLMMSII